MYADEYLPDDAVFDNDDIDVSIDGSSSMDTEEIERKKRVELYKRNDPDYYSFKMSTIDDEGYRKYQRVRIYSSPYLGYIRNASTGIREEYRAGSKYEDLFFSVRDSGLYTRTELNKETRKLFYRSPEECERHLHIKISQQIKNDWNKKYMATRMKLFL
jgi:hypothetical protein